MHTRRATLLVIAAAAVATATIAVARNESADASTRPASFAELNPPADVLGRLPEGLGIQFEVPDEALVNVKIAGTAARAVAATQYATELKDASPDQYLYEIASTAGLGTPVKKGDLVWVVVYDNLNIQTTGPMTDAGVPAEGAIIRHGYVLVSASTGEFLTAVFTN